MSFGLYGSREMVVICDEMVHMIKRVLAGVSITDETLALDVIREVGHRGDFLTHEHTFEVFKQELFFPTLFRRQSIDQWLGQGARMIHEVAHEQVEEILANTGPVELPPGVEAELERALRRAVEEIEKNSRGV